METKLCNVQIKHGDLRNNNGSELFSVGSNITMMNIIVRENEGRFMETKQ